MELTNPTRDNGLRPVLATRLADQHAADIVASLNHEDLRTASIALAHLPPARVVEVAPAPVPGRVWIAGYWNWNGYRYVWRPGYWVAARPGYRYYPARWVHEGPTWRFHVGYWGRIR